MELIKKRKQLTPLQILSSKENLAIGALYSIVGLATYLTSQVKMMQPSTHATIRIAVMAEIHRIKAVQYYRKEERRLKNETHTKGS